MVKRIISLVIQKTIISQVSLNNPVPQLIFKLLTMGGNDDYEIRLKMGFK